jgi:hypothetical protein
MVMASPIATIDAGRSLVMRNLVMKNLRIPTINMPQKLHQVGKRHRGAG